MPVGTPGNDTLVKFLRLWDEPIVWRVIGHDLEGMPEGSVTLLADKIIACLSFDAKEPKTNDDRRNYGNNDYTISNIRQWLNSDRVAGEWYSAQYEYDQAPDAENVGNGFNAYDMWPGFLNGATKNEISALIETTRHIGGRLGNGTSCVDKILLLTSNEYGLETIANNGVKIPYFTDNNSRIAQPTEQCVAHSNYPNSPSSADANFIYLTATSFPKDDHHVAYVHLDGSFMATYAVCYGGAGIRPACNIKSTVMLSAEPDADGCYTILT